MSAVLAITLVLILFSLLSTAYLLSSTLIPLLPAHILTRTVPPSAFGLSPPAAKLSPWSTATVFLALADLLGLGLLLWQAVLDAQMGTAPVEVDAGNVARLWLLLTSRPTILLILSFLAYISARVRRPLSLGRSAALLWAPSITLITGTTIIMSLLASYISANAFFSSLICYSAVLVIGSTTAFAFYLVTRRKTPENLTWASLGDGTLRKPFATDPLEALRSSDSWLTSDRGSSISTLSSFEFSTEENHTHSSHHTRTPSTRRGSHGSRPRKSIERPERTPVSDIATQAAASRPSTSMDRPATSMGRPSTSMGRPSTSLGRPSTSLPPTPTFGIHPGTPTSTDALIKAWEGTDTGLQAYTSNRGDIERGRAFSLSTNPDANGNNQKAKMFLLTKEDMASVGGWTAYVFIPFFFSLPFLINGHLSQESTIASQILLALSITLTSPIMSLLTYLSKPAPPEPELRPQPSAASLVPASVVSSRAASPTIHTMPQRTWVDAGMAKTRALKPWERAVNFLRPTPKLVMRPVQPEPEKTEKDGDGMVEVDLREDETRTRSVFVPPPVPVMESKRATFSWRDSPQPPRSARNSVRSSMQPDRSPRNSATPSNNRESHAESFHTQILKVERLSSSAAQILSMVPPLPQPPAIFDEDAAPRVSMESMVSESGSSRSKKARTPPPPTPPPGIPLPPLPPMTPRRVRKRTSGRSASMSAVSTPSSSVHPDPPVADTPAVPQPLRLSSQPGQAYQPRILHRSANSTGSIDSVTRGMLERMVPSSQVSRMNSVNGAPKVRRVTNPSDEKSVDVTTAVTSAREVSLSKLSKGSTGSKGHHALPSLHMDNKGSQSAARWSEDLEKALKEAHAAEVRRKLHRRQPSSKDTLASVHEDMVLHDMPSSLSVPTPPLSIKKARTPSPEPERMPEQPVFTPVTVIARESFIVPHEATPPVVDARPLPTAFTPSGPSVNAFHLPRKGLRISQAPLKPPPPPRGRAGPTYVSSGQATPSNTPIHPLRLLALRQALYKDGAPVPPSSTSSSGRRPLSTLVENPAGSNANTNAGTADANHVNLAPLEGMTFESVIHSTPLTTPKGQRERKTSSSSAGRARQRVLKLVGSASSFASGKSRGSGTLASPTEASIMLSAH